MRSGNTNHQHRLCGLSFVLWIFCPCISPVILREFLLAHTIRKSNNSTLITLQHVSIFSPCYAYSLFGATRKCSFPQLSCLLSCFRCPFPWLWWNHCLGCDYLLFMKLHWKRGHRRRNPVASSLVLTSGRRQPGAGQTLSPAQHLEKAAEAETEESSWYPLLPSWSFSCYALFQPLLSSLFPRLPISSLALEEDENVHREEAAELLCLFAGTSLFPWLCHLPKTSPLPSTLTGCSLQQELPLASCVWVEWCSPTPFITAPRGTSRKEKKISHRYK